MVKLFPVVNFKQTHTSGVFYDANSVSFNYPVRKRYLLDERT